MSNPTLIRHKNGSATLVYEKYTEFHVSGISDIEYKNILKSINPKRFSHLDFDMLPLMLEKLIMPHNCSREKGGRSLRRNALSRSHIAREAYLRGQKETIIKNLGSISKDFDAIMHEELSRLAKVKRRRYMDACENNRVRYIVNSANSNDSISLDGPSPAS